MLSNIQEKKWWDWTGHDPRLCPVIFYLWGGFLLVMRRASPAVSLPSKEDFDGLPLDYKLENFGLIDEKPVLIDYGS
jgi:hypothetical protein